MLITLCTRYSKSKAQPMLMKKAQFSSEGDTDLDGRKTNGTTNVPQSVTPTSRNLQDSQQKINLNESTFGSQSFDISPPSLEDFQHHGDCASLDVSFQASDQSPTNDLLIPPRSREDADSGQVRNLPDRDTAQLLHLNPRQRRRERRRLHEFAGKCFL
ncbi:hypothetical protein EG68_01915 [Paragonimus skrjabini miyazakii]|uniref:Uncharacterized protein n=1 Tax=Paragonimus skrjabini miyazakii TaxID=59628 RepID=A0A8S9Z114_9TREM|nr:hypothetical protein EG68_01915 [Paragonimus skrjabini miyazakii]